MRYMCLLCLSANYFNSSLIQIFSESDKDVIVEVSRYISIGFFGLAGAAGVFYFLGVQLF